MAEKLLIADALDERDFLRIKIHKAIQNCRFVTVKRKKDEKTSNGVDPEVFIEKAKSDYQSITDMIVRLKKINSAIIVSNATTNVTLKSGLTMTRAEAIARRKELKSKNSEDLEFEFIQAMQQMISTSQRDYSVLTKKADSIAETYNGNLSSKDKDLNIKQIEATKVLTAEEYPEIIDPLDLEKKYTERVDQYTTLAKELDTAIKVSNATTYIEI
jgi:hypothetical protein